jgi:hypothetical protein
MVTKTQVPSKSYHNIALVPLNNTRQQINHGAPRPVTTTKSGQQTVPPDGG